MRVLIAEDEASLAKQLTSSISEAGYAVDCAGDGERADFLTQTAVRRDNPRSGATKDRRSYTVAELAGGRPKTPLALLAYEAQQARAAGHQQLASEIDQ